MDVQITENKLIALYFEVDNLVIAYKKYQKRKGRLPVQKQGRRPALNGAEICTVLVAYHFSGYKCFEYYYKNSIQKHFKDCFPDAPSYECFLSYIPRVTDMMYLWLLYSCSQSKRTGLYFIDSKKLEVCHLKREKSNRVFKDYARKGKSSMGWFYGLKIHLVINNLGQIISFKLTSGNTADNNQDLLQYLLKSLEGCCVGDKGYLTKLFDFFYENGLHILTKPKKNMKNKLMPPLWNKIIDKRGVIESVFDILTSICDIEHSRHRKPQNAFTHIFGSLIAYQFLDKKPTVFYPSLKKQNITICA